MKGGNNASSILGKQSMGFKKLSPGVSSDAPGICVPERAQCRRLRRLFDPVAATRLRHEGYSKSMSSTALMDYVGWRDVHSAVRFIDGDASLGEWAR